MLPTLLKDCVNNNLTYRFLDPRPTVMVFNVTSRCNSRCIMCDIWRNQKHLDMDTEKIREVISDEFFRDIEVVGISGGEPTLRKDLSDIVEVFEQKAARLQKVIVTSNGLDTGRMSEQIGSVAAFCQTRCLPFSFRISLDGLEESHNAVRRIPEAYQKAMRSIAVARELSAKHDFSFGLSSTLTPTNVYDVRRLYELATELGVDIVFAFAYVVEASFKNTEREQSILLNDEEKEFLATFYHERLMDSSLFDGEGYHYEFQVKHLREDTDRTIVCPFSNQGIMLDANGDVHYCLNSRVIGNVMERPIQQIYFDRGNLEYRKGFPENLCRKCFASCMTQVAARKKVYPYFLYLARLAHYKFRNRKRAPGTEDSSPDVQM
jgi:MoaA/NifB/PqqE/SkfB family radical SAM enzyme